LGTGLLRPTDFGTLRSWQEGKQLTFTFGKTPPSALKESLQTVVEGMLDAKARTSDAGYILRNSNDQLACNLDAMIYLEREEWARCEVRLNDVGGVATEWQLTETGLAAMELSAYLSQPTRLLLTRADVPDEELTTFELMTQLASDGWECRVPGAMKSRKQRFTGAGGIWQ
jgi:hypothetical protein